MSRRTAFWCCHNDCVTSNASLYLGVGTVLSESVTSKIRTAGSTYISKSLSSTPANWMRIAHLLEQPGLTGALVKLTARDFVRIARAEYASAADALFTRLATKPYLLLVHEEVVAPRDLEVTAGQKIERDSMWEGESEWGEATDWDGLEWNDLAAREYFGTLPREVREKVERRLSSHGITVTTYKRNAEASVFATAFVDDTHNNLLFRIYVPAGRLYEDEFSRVLELFHDWLGSVKRQTVRQSGYRTPSGRVVEFFGEPGMSSESVSDELREFARFLNIVEDTASAEVMLHDLGVAPERASELVQRYSRAARRVVVDTKHTRERLILGIRQQLETELVDELPDLSSAELGDLVGRLVPTSPFQASPSTTSLAGLLGANESTSSSTGASPVINLQIIERVEGIVAQNVNGPITVGTPAADLIELIRQFGGDSVDELETSARELADTGAPPAARLRARERLKNFLTRNGARVEQSLYSSAWKWVVDSLGDWLQ